MVEESSTERQASPPLPPPSLSPPASPLPPPLVSPTMNPTPNSHDGYFDNLIIQNGLNFERSAMPTRILFYHNQNWEEFTDEVLESLRSSFSKGKPMMLVMIEGAKYAVDFLHMVQIDLRHGNQRSIAWIDEKGRPFFPQQFLDDDDLHENPHNVQIVEDIEDDGRPDKGKRKMEHGEDLGAGNDGSGSKRLNLDRNIIIPDPSGFPNTRLLSKTCEAYTYFSDLFISSITKFDPEAIVTSIHEYQTLAPLVIARWQDFKKQIDIAEATRGKANVAYAWYTATKEEVASISSHGFSLPTDASGLPPIMRAGIYLADLDSPNYSALQSQVEKDGEKYIILCRVVLGSVEKVHLEFPQTSASREEFDTGCDNPNNPKWYVVWNADMNKRILPVCVVGCKTTAVVPEQLKIVDSGGSYLPNLILEMKKCIPFSNVYALDIIFDALKNGRMSRAGFMKRLRLIGSDHMILTMAKEVFGEQ